MQLEADASAPLAKRDDTVKKAEEAVKAREAAVGSAEAEAATGATTSLTYTYFVKGGFPMVTLVEGQTFDTDGCGDWAKQYADA